MNRQQKHFNKLKLIGGNANRGLAARIAGELGQPLEDAIVDRFADGEVRVDLNCVVRGTDVFIIQPICQTNHSPLVRFCQAEIDPGEVRDVSCSYQSINDNLMELLVMIDAARRASAERITAVVPYMAYAKQEKKKRGHEPITAKMVANLIATAGADRLLTVDLHTPAIEGFFDIPVDHMRMALPMATYFRRDLGLAGAVVVSPDAGGVARATEFRDHLKADLRRDRVRDEMAIAFKRRTPKGDLSLVDIVGDVAGRPAVVFDDMIQSGATLLQVVERLLERGATAVHAAAVHADFTPGTEERLYNSPLKTLVLSDTTDTGLRAAGDTIRLVTAARILAQAIWRIHVQDSVGWIFDTLRESGELPPIVREG